jgi:diketogulonate reductase-like aldo/keto reductase
VPGDADEPYLDCVILHEPLDTLEATRDAMLYLQALTPNPVRKVGISNVTIEMLTLLWPGPAADPAPPGLPFVVQNPFHAGHANQWDSPVREFCRTNSVRYQGFWVLTANRALWSGSRPRSFVTDIVEGAQVDAAVAFYSLILGIGINFLTGTTDPEHMMDIRRGLVTIYRWVSGSDAARAKYNLCVKGLRELTGATTGSDQSYEMLSWLHKWNHEGEVTE